MLTGLEFFQDPSHQGVMFTNTLYVPSYSVNQIIEVLGFFTTLQVTLQNGFFTLGKYVCSQDDRSLCSYSGYNGIFKYFTVIVTICSSGRGWGCRAPPRAMNKGAGHMSPEGSEDAATRGRKRLTIKEGKTHGNN